MCRWGVESLLFPELTANLSTGFYTRSDIQHLVTFARDRGVRVVPEFDMPASDRLVQFSRSDSHSVLTRCRNTRATLRVSSRCRDGEWSSAMPRERARRKHSRRLSVSRKVQPNTMDWIDAMGNVVYVMVHFAVEQRLYMF